MSQNRPQQSTVHRAAFLLLAAILVVGLYFWVSRTGTSTPRPVGSSTPSRIDSPPESSKAHYQARGHTSILQQITQTGAQPDIRLRGLGLQDLKKRILALPKEEASILVREILDSGTDLNSGDPFVLAADGSLRTSPTLRTLLLDLLDQIDPMGAATYAEKILSTPGSADEWAVGLRSYARNSPSADKRNFLQGKVREFLNNEGWRSDPSVGYLEAFDVAVHVGGTELVGDLARVLRDTTHPAAAHAAYLALDRMTLREPAVMLEELLKSPEASSGREETRANYFARANLSDPVQRELLERYLLTQDRNATELRAFAGVFPNANYMISNNLLTQNSTPSGADLARQDRVALQTVEAWIKDPRFDRLRPYLEKSRQRLLGFVPQAQ